MAQKNKYNKSLVHKVKENIAFEKQQQTLKKKHGISGEVIIIEKTNIFKFIINILLVLTKLMCWILLIILAITGLICLIYPSPRSDLFRILYESIKQLQTYLPWNVSFTNFVGIY